MKKRTKIIIISAMVLLLGVTGYLNVMLNSSVSGSPADDTTTTVGYFQTYRTTRESTRDQEMLYYDAIIANESSTQDAVKNAENAKLQLISQMEQELIVEGLIKAKGFEDCVISITDSNVNAVVKAEELSSTEVAQIVAVIQSQLNTGIENIKIIPVE
ncbi:MAG: SpoIIIAH-like family protein [Clostridia bacterium]|nr:SpoIIIAH-like family protein [Clostridia bacterium]